MTGRDYDRIRELAEAVTPETLSAWLDAQLDARGMTGADVAALTGLSRSAVSRVRLAENSRVRLVAMLLALAGIDVREGTSGMVDAR